MENNHRKIYQLIEDDYFDESKVKLPKDLLIKCKEEFNSPRFIPHDVKKKIQQVCLKYGFFHKL